MLRSVDDYDEREDVSLLQAHGKQGYFAAAALSKRPLLGDVSGDLGSDYLESTSGIIERSVNDSNSWLRTAVLGVGFFNSSYDAFALNIVLVILSYAHTPPLKHLGLVATATMLGVMCGQIMFGSIADILGKKRAFIVTQLVVIAGAIAASFASGTTSVEFMLHLVVSRIFMGLGIGGEYPLSATFAAEASSSSDTANRGKKMATVFALQGAGMMFAPIVIFLLLKYVLPHEDFERAWRIPLAITALPGLIFIAFRLFLREPTRPVSLPNRGFRNAPQEVEVTIYDRVQALFRHGRMILGCALAWLIFDVVFYANALFSGQVLTQAAKITPDTPKELLYEHIYSLTKAAVCLSLIAVPGYLVGIRLIDVIGRRPLQITGFALMASNFGIMITLLTWMPELMNSKLGHMLFVASYGLTFFFANLGPNLVTYVMSGEAFPFSIAGTALGICAAAGKVGAMIGTLTMPQLLHYDLRVSLAFCAGCSILGILVTVLMTHETMGLDQPHDYPELTAHASDMAESVTSAPSYDATGETSSAQEGSDKIVFDEAILYEGKTLKEMLMDD